MRWLEVDSQTVQNALTVRMDYRSNLYAPNSYYLVVQHFKMCKIAGWCHNGYYGASEVLKPEWEEFTARVGATIANLHGGLRYIEQGIDHDFRPRRKVGVAVLAHENGKWGIEVAMDTRDVPTWQKYDRFPLDKLALVGVRNQVGAPNQVGG